MTKLNFLLMCCCLCLSTQSLFGKKLMLTASEELQMDIVQYLRGEHPELMKTIQNASLPLIFMVNSHNRIVIISEATTGHQKKLKELLNGLTLKYSNNKKKKIFSLRVSPSYLLDRKTRTKSSLSKP